MGYTFGAKTIDINASSPSEIAWGYGKLSPAFYGVIALIIVGSEIIRSCAIGIALTLLSLIALSSYFVSLKGGAQ